MSTNNTFNKIVIQSENNTYAFNDEAKNTLLELADEFTRTFDPGEASRTRLPRELGFDYCRFDAETSFKGYVKELCRLQFKTPQECIWGLSMCMVAYALHLCMGAYALNTLYNNDFDTTKYLKESIIPGMPIDWEVMNEEWVYTDKYVTWWESFTKKTSMGEQCFHWCAQWGLMTECEDEPVWQITRLRAYLLGEMSKCTPQAVHESLSATLKMRLLPVALANQHEKWIIKEMLASLRRLVDHLADYLDQSMSQAGVDSLAMFDFWHQAGPVSYLESWRQLLIQLGYFLIDENEQGEE